MVIQFGCPFCGAVAEVEDDLAGSRATCPACDGPLLVPARDEALAHQTPAAPRAVDSAARPSDSGAAAPLKLWQTPVDPAVAPLTPTPLAADDEGLSRPIVLPREEGVSVDRWRVARGRPSRGSARRGPGGPSTADDARERRKFWTNVAMLALGLAVLLATLLVLLRLTGG